MQIDVLIVGGGPAGLSAGLVLGRCHRKVLICDDEHPRNRASPAVHGLLGNEGCVPSVFLRRARGELSCYPTIASCRSRVIDIRPARMGFEFCCKDRTRGEAIKILLATGIADELPEIAGIEQFYGTAIHHCLYCDGYEYAGKPVAAYGKGDKGADLAIMMRHWVSDLTLCTDGTELRLKAARRLENLQIPIRNEPIRSLEGEGRQLAEIMFEHGPALRCDALFFATGCHQASDLWQRLGCIRDPKGGLLTDPDTEETSTKGVYAAGDVSRDVLLVAVAVAEGAKAAVAINKAFLRRDGLCD